MENRGNSQMAIIAVALFVLVSLGVVIFFYNQNQALKKELSKYLEPTPVATTKPTEIPFESPSSSPSGQVKSPTPTPNAPIITNIKSGQKISNPVVIKGTVPAGWMFEGVFPVKLISSRGVVIAEGQAKENKPGAWQTGLSVEFTATINYDSLASGSGKIRLENDNPSGLPENSKKFELPISF